MSDDGPIQGRAYFDADMAWDAFWTGDAWKAWRPFAAALFVMPAFLAFKDHSPDGLIVAMIPSAAAAIIGGAWLVISVRLRPRRFGTRERDLRYGFDAAGVSVGNGTGQETREPWTNIRRIREGRRGLWVVGKNSTHYIPFNAFTEGDLPRVKALIARHVRP